MPIFCQAHFGWGRDPTGFEHAVADGDLDEQPCQRRGRLIGANDIMFLQVLSLSYEKFVQAQHLTAAIRGL